MARGRPARRIIALGLGADGPHWHFFLLAL